MIRRPDPPLASQDQYRTPADRRVGPLSRILPSLPFYGRVVRAVFQSAAIARRGIYGDDAWCDSSYTILRAVEAAGCRVTAEGLDELHRFEGPAVFVGNHMSTLETMVLPILIQPVKPITFVVKPSLIDYPVFGHIMRSRNPIVVSRDNPRQDLVTVLEEGARRLADGRSIVLFPQTTRSSSFDPSRFNSLGVKLAKNAGVPVVPVALRTDAWGNGRLLKDFGPIDPAKPVHFAFGAPLRISGSGRAEHEQVVDFISGTLSRWGVALDPGM